MIEHEELIIKKIHTEQRFSDVVFKKFRSERFGITYDCPLDLNKVTIKKELCDWEELKVPIYTSKTYKESVWIHGGPKPKPTWGALLCGEDEAEICVEDTTCLYIEVVNQNGDPVKEYPIYIDGGNVGITNDAGILRTNIEDASLYTTHTLDICYCFETVGQCSQIKFVITVDEANAKEACPTPVIPCEST